MRATSAVVSLQCESSRRLSCRILRLDGRLPAAHAPRKPPQRLPPLLPRFARSAPRAAVSASWRRMARRHARCAPAHRWTQKPASARRHVPPPTARRAFRTVSLRRARNVPKAMGSWATAAKPARCKGARHATTTPPPAPRASATLQWSTAQHVCPAQLAVRPATTQPAAHTVERATSHGMPPSLAACHARPRAAMCAAPTVPTSARSVGRGRACAVDG